MLSTIFLYIYQGHIRKHSDLILKAGVEVIWSDELSTINIKKQIPAGRTENVLKRAQLTVAREGNRLFYGCI